MSDSGPSRPSGSGALPVASARPVRFGRTGLEAGNIAFGTAQIGGNWGATDADAAVATIRAAVDLGVTVFDSAYSYGWGAAEAILGQALRVFPRESFVIATKGGLRREGELYLRDCRGPAIRHDVEASLRALDVDHIDLYQLHWPDPDTSFEETAAELVAQRDAGKIRHIGVSNFSTDEMAALDAIVPLGTVQPSYNMLRREAETDVLPFADQSDLGVLVWGPLAAGLLTGQLTVGTVFAPDDWRSQSTIYTGPDYAKNLVVADRLADLAGRQLGLTLSQLAVAWVLAHPAVDLAIVGTRNIDHVRAAIVAAEQELSPDVLAEIDRILVDGVPIGGPSPESRG